MKTALSATVALLILAGCTTSSDGTKTLDVARVATIAHSAAHVGTAIYIRNHPETRPMFQASAAALASLDASGDYDPVKFADALATLPIGALQGADGDVYISTFIVVWDAFSAQAVGMDTTLWVKPVLKAVRTGMEKALVIP